MAGQENIESNDLVAISRRLQYTLQLSDSNENRLEADVEPRHNEILLPYGCSNTPSDLDFRRPIAQVDQVVSVPAITSATTPQNTCLLLDRLPGELRNTIYEYVFREPSSIIVVDLRNTLHKDRTYGTSPCSLTLACRQIYEECGRLRYDINKVHIFVPVFSAASISLEERERRDEVASRFQNIANIQLETKQLRRVRLFLGRLPRLTHIRWTEFLSSWMSIRDAVVTLSGICTSLELSFEAYLARDVLAQHKFKVGTSVDARGENELLLPDGSVAETTESERERLRRIKATIAKTIALPG